MPIILNVVRIYCPRDEKKFKKVGNSGEKYGTEMKIKLLFQVWSSDVDDMREVISPCVPNRLNFKTDLKLLSEL